MIFGIARFAFRAMVWITVLGIPLFGVWLSSSLAAYAHGPRWLICLAGTMLFPLLPLAWELRGQRKSAARNLKAKDAARLFQLSFWDRMVLRTLAVNLCFLLPLLYFFPKPSFRALATRGDWFLQHAHPNVAAKIRPYLFSGVEKMSWMYGLTANNPYEAYQDQDPPPPPPIQPTMKGAAPSSKAQTWPLPVGLHPVLRSMPIEAQGDYRSAAAFIGQALSSPSERIKAIHDFVIWHLSYDYPAYEHGVLPDQRSEAVFAARKAVCAGYARLMSDMGQALGIDVRYITGQVRESDGSLAAAGHAWNAAKIDGQWYLIDATWNDQDHRKYPDSNRDEGYETMYFLAPPEVFLLDHLPKDERWQLTQFPLKLHDFLRQPKLEPNFMAAGMSLADKDLRAQVQTDESRWSFSLHNPQRHKIFARVSPNTKGEAESSAREKCRVSGTDLVTIDCPLSAKTSVIEFYGGPRIENESYALLGSFEVQYR